MNARPKPLRYTVADTGLTSKCAKCPARVTVHPLCLDCQQKERERQARRKERRKAAQGA